VVDPEFGKRVMAHKRTHLLPVGTRVRITENWEAHAGETGIVTDHSMVEDIEVEGGVYIVLDGDKSPTVSEWANEAHQIYYSVSAQRDSVEIVSHADPDRYERLRDKMWEVADGWTDSAQTEAERAWASAHASDIKKATDIP
jgi:hypothetical protein